MGKPRQRCKFCGRQADVDVIVSKRGICTVCARERSEEQARQMEAKEGPMYETWKRNWTNAGGSGKA